MDILTFSFNGVAPICVMVLLGMLLRKIGLISHELANGMNKLCFQLFIPLKIFTQIAATDLTASVNMTTILFSFFATLIVLILLCLVTPRFLQGPRCGEFIQGVYRSNTAILGLPLLANLYGESACTALALAMPALIIQYNTLSPIVLTNFAQGKKVSAKAMLLKIVSNPFLIAAVLGVICAALKIKWPVFLEKTASSLSAVGTPLALISLGAVTRMSDFRNSGKLAFSASVLRLVLIPAVMLPLAALLGIRGEQMAAVVCFFCTPTAVGGYVLAKNLDGDGELAGQILLQTTMLSFMTMFATIAILRSLNLM